MSAPAEVFELLQNALESAAIRYAVGGSWASIAYGEPRFTNDVDVVVELTNENLTPFLNSLPREFYVDVEEAERALRAGRAFNIIHMSTVLKFDLFPSRAFPLGAQELDRAVMVAGTGLSKRAAPFVTPEDILLAKLYWFKSGREISEVQWRDIEGLVRAIGAKLDRSYLQANARTLGVDQLLSKALPGME